MRRPDQQHPPLLTAREWHKLPPLVGRALYALGLRYVTPCPDRSPLAMQCFGLVAHDRILTGDMRHA